MQLPENQSAAVVICRRNVATGFEMDSLTNSNPSITPVVLVAVVGGGGFTEGFGKLWHFVVIIVTIVVEHQFSGSFTLVHKSFFDGLRYVMGFLFYSGW